MSDYQQFLNEYRAVEYRQARMNEAYAERSLRTVRGEQAGRQSERSSRVAVLLDPSTVRVALSAVAAHLASFL